MQILSYFVMMIVEYYGVDAIIVRVMLLLMITIIAIVCTCLDMFLPVRDLNLFPERVLLVTCKGQRHFNTFC